MPRFDRRKIEDVIHVIGWVDEQGNLISDVPDRFQARYMFANEVTGETLLSGCTLTEKGLTSSTIRDVVTFGFSTDEYLDIIEWERRSAYFIQSEDELTDLMGIRFQPPYP